MTTTQPEIDSLVERARAAQQRYEATGSQQYFDKAAAAAAWALMEPSRNAELAEFAVAETGLGNVADKIRKITVKRWDCCAIFGIRKVLVWFMTTQ